MTRIWLLAIWLSTATDRPTFVDVFYEPGPCYAAAERRASPNPYRRTDCLEVPLNPTTGYGALSSFMSQPKAFAEITGQNFYTIVPCRVADTRFFGGAIMADSWRNFQVRGNFAQGAQSTCGIPAEATAVMVNIAAVYPSGEGWLIAWPYGQPRPGISTLNYSSGSIIAGGGLVSLCDPGLSCVSDLSVWTSQNSDVVIDVTAYVRK